jgi:hypothetical protein
MKASSSTRATSARSALSDLRSLRALSKTRDARLFRSARGMGAIALGLFVVVVFALGLAPASRAQGPAPAPTDAGAGAGDSTYGCVESVPKGAQRPLVVDAFPDRGTSGWAATLSIVVRHGKGERVLPSGLDLSSAVEARKVLKQAGFSVPDQDGGASARLWTEPDDPQKPQAQTHLELPLVLLPPNPGRNGMVLPPLPVAVARANGEIATVCTHAHSILVEDPIANTPNAMPRQNPPGVVQREEWTALKKALLYGSLGLAIGAILALLIWRKVNQPKPVPPPPPPRPPWEVALEELDEVRHAGLLEMNRYSEFFDRTSDALRRYLGARFGFDGLESTTDEILASLKKQAGGFIRDSESEGELGESGTSAKNKRPSFGPAPGIAFESVASFLRDCDLVKFANLTPTPDQCASSLTTGERIVRGTMPMGLGTSRDFVDDTPAVPMTIPQAPAAPPPPPRRARSPWEPPDPEEPAATGARNQDDTLRDPGSPKEPPGGSS